MTAPPIPATAPAARRAVLLALLRRQLALPEFIDAAAGHLHVIPVCRPNVNQRGCGDHGPDCGKPGKIPLVKWKPYQETPPPATEVRSWLQHWPTANWALITGAASGILLLDKDGADAAALDVPPTVRAFTGRAGGCHYYMVYPTGLTIPNGTAFLPKWDVKGQDGLLFLPGSLHKSGNTYRLDTASLAHDFADLTTGLLAKVQAGGTNSHSSRRREPLDMAAVFAGVAEGARDDTLWQLVDQLCHAGIPEPVTEIAVLAAAAACVPPFDEDVVREKVRRAYSAPARGALTEDASADHLAGQAALDQARAEIAELRANLRAADAEIATLKRQRPEAFVPRLIRALGALDADPSTRGVAPVALALLTERAATQGPHGEVPPICWRGDERSRDLGRTPNTLRKALDALADHGIIEREYKPLGDPAAGDWRRELRLHLSAEIPADWADALDWIRRRLHEDRAPKVRVKQTTACAVCRTAHCPDHPDAAIEPRAASHCTQCGGVAAPEHVHQPQRPRTTPTPAVLHLLKPRAPAPAVDAKIALTYLEDPKRKNCVYGSPPDTVVEQVAATAERVAAAADAAGLSPVDTLAAKLKAYEDAALAALGAAATVKQLVPFGTITLTEGAVRPLTASSPEGGAGCDRCHAPLKPAEMIRCGRCSGAGVT